MEEIIASLGRLKRMAQRYFPIVKAELDEMIERKVESSDEIERVLDNLFSYLQLGIGDEEFKRLNSYYSGIDPKGAKFYTDWYKTMISEE